MSPDGDGEPEADDTGFFRFSEADGTGCFRMSSETDGSVCFRLSSEADGTGCSRMSPEEDDTGCFRMSSGGDREPEADVTDCFQSFSVVSEDDSREIAFWNSVVTGVLAGVRVPSEGRSEATKACSHSGIWCSS